MGWSLSRISHNSQSQLPTHSAVKPLLREKCRSGDRLELALPRRRRVVLEVSTLPIGERLQCLASGSSTGSSFKDLGS